MPVFEAKNLDTEFEGQALLTAILQPTRAARCRALRLGRRRAAKGSLLVDPSTVEPRFPTSGDELETAAIPSH